VDDRRLGFSQCWVQIGIGAYPGGERASIIPSCKSGFVVAFKDNKKRKDRKKKRDGELKRINQITVLSGVARFRRCESGTVACCLGSDFELVTDRAIPKPCFSLNSTSLYQPHNTNHITNSEQHHIASFSYLIENESN